MASRLFREKVLNLEIGLVMIVGKISIHTDGTVLGYSGEGFVATKAGTGQYLVTLNDKYTSLISANVCMKAAAAVDLHPQLDDYSTTSKTYLINTLAVDGDGAVAAADPGVACELHFQLFLKNSSV
jgi:hypothetical protein